MNRQNLTAVTRKVKLPGGGTGKAVRWMNTIPHPSADGPSAGPMAAPNRQLTGIDACLSESDARAHNASAHALRRHGVALTEKQFDAIHTAIQSSSEGSVAVWLTVSAAEEPRRSTSYAGISFTNDDSEVVRSVSIATDDFRGGGDEVNDVADRLANFKGYGFNTELIAANWESTGDEYGQETTGHFCNLRLAN